MVLFRHVLWCCVVAGTTGVVRGLLRDTRHHHDPSSRALLLTTRGGSVMRETQTSAGDSKTVEEEVTKIPVIDIGRAMRGEPTAADVAAIRRACELGFFHVTNHGVPDAVLEAFDGATRSFFALDARTKLGYERTAKNARGYASNEFTKQRRDVKELYDYGHTPCPRLPADAPENTVMDGHNQIPSDDVLPGFASAIEAYYQACARVCAALIRCVARSLDLAPDALDDIWGPDHASFLRLNSYPPLGKQAARFERDDRDLDREQEPIKNPLDDDDDTSASAEDAATPLADLAGPRLGINRHFDAGGLTLLRQDPRVPRALQMNLNAHRDVGQPRWVDVGPVPGALTVNCGDMLQVVANDRYVAAEHRVLATPSGTGGEGGPITRYSAAFFFNPRYDARIEPRVDVAHPKYRPFTYGHFRKRRFEGDYENEGVEEIQIAHFRL